MADAGVKSTGNCPQILLATCFTQILAEKPRVDAPKCHAGRRIPLPDAYLTPGGDIRLPGPAEHDREFPVWKGFTTVRPQVYHDGGMA
jgi:hypothetical protein